MLGTPIASLTNKHCRNFYFLCYYFRFRYNDNITAYSKNGFERNSINSRSSKIKRIGTYSFSRRETKI